MLHLYRNYPQRTRLLWAVLLLLVSFTPSFGQLFIQVGSGTATTSTTGGSGTAAVYNRYWESRKTQVIYTAAELIAAGFTTSADITALALYVETDINGTLPNFTIKMKHTTNTAFTAFDATGLTTVHTSTPSGTGATIGNWVTFTFSTPFNWNGTDNLLIDFCHEVLAGFNSTGAIRQYAGASNSLRSSISGSVNQCPVTTGGTNGSNKPQIRLTVVAPPCSGTPPVLTASATPSSACVGSNVTLNVNPPFAGGLTYQWQADTGMGFANIVGATSPTSVVAFTGVTTQYRCVVTCTNSGISTNSTTATVNPIAAPPFATLPYSQSFDGTWASACGTRDIPDVHWQNNPSTGNNSWRRNDDAGAAGWTSPASGAYTPAGALGTTNSARFHSYSASSGQQGSLDLYINLSAAGAKLLNFYHINTTGTDVLEIFLSTDGGITFSPTPLASFGTAASWTLRSVTITSSAPNAVVRFRATSDFGFTDIGIDEVNISLATVTAVGPNGAIIGNGSLPDVANGTNYGGWFVGAQVDRTFYIKNIGTSTINISSLTSSNATNFQIVSFPALGVVPGDSTAFTVRFTGNTAGAYNSTITLNSTGAPNPYTFQVAGQMGDFVSSYTFAQCSGTYTEITGGTVPTITSSTFGAGVGQPMSSGNDLDDVSATGLPIGFTFNFNNTNYTTFSVNSNGYLVLGSTLPGNGNYTPISSTFAVPGVVAALPGDLQATAGEIRYEVQGTAPNRVLIVQWKNFGYFGATGDALNFQAHLREGSNQIRVVYGSITKNPTARTVQVGLRGATNTDFNNRMSTTSWSATMPGTANNSTISFTPTIIPASGLTYIWSPRSVQVLGGMPLAAIDAGSVTPSVTNGTDFGSAATNEQKDVTFTIRNNSGTPISISSITSSAPEFTIVAPAPTSVPSTCSSPNTNTFVVRFQAATPGTYNATISVNSNAPGLSSYTFAVTATVANPSISISGGTPLTPIPNGSTSPNVVDGTDFGNVDVTATPFAEQTYTISNGGPGALSVGAVTSSNPRFTVSVAPTSPVAPSGTTTFVVRFTPLTSGVQNATITVPNNDPSASPYTFAVRATAVQPVMEVLGLGNNIPNNKFLPTSTDGTFLGVATSSANITSTFTIRNNGNSALAISGITMATSGSSFSIVGAPSSVAAGDEADFTVSFNPANGGQQDTVVIATNFPAAPTFRFIVSAGAPVVASLPANLADGDVLISPNPSRDKFNIQIGGARYTSVKAVVYDVAGRQVKTVDMPQFNGSMDINLADLQGGTYILMLETGGEKIARKLIKQ